MFNRLFTHLTKNKVLYLKQSGFQKAHSAEHVIINAIIN